jgi:ABC-type transport system involved in multi-copper enzyme maturation permease subunit
VPNSVRILLLTVGDQMRQKSFLLLLALCVLFLFLIRGCYGGNYMVNGQQVDALTVAWQTSRIAFHIIASGAMLIAVMLSMRLFSRDREDGSLVLFLARPVHRFEYLLGRIGGVWTLSFLFMFILHLTIFIIAFINTHAIIPGYLTASVVCALNLLFMAALVCLLGFFVPDFMAALIAIIIAAVGFASDTAFAVMQSSMVKSALPPGVESHPSIWRMLWPKMTALQYYGASLISHESFVSMGPLHPGLNALLWCGVVITVLLIYYRRKEI